MRITRAFLLRLNTSFFSLRSTLDAIIWYFGPAKASLRSRSSSHEIPGATEQARTKVQSLDKVYPQTQILPLPPHNRMTVSKLPLGLCFW